MKKALHSTISIIAIMIGVTIQVTVLLLFINSHKAQQTLPILTSLQITPSVLMAWGVSHFLNQSSSSQRWVLIILLTLFNIFIPVLGFIIIVLALLFTRRTPEDSDQQDILAVDQPKYIPSLEKIGSKFGAGGARIQLLNTGARNTVRRAALLLISSYQGTDNNTILRQALNDNNDEIRLLAYSLLDQQEQNINQEIDRSIHFLGKFKDSKQKLIICKYLSRLYYEMAYCSLIHNEILDHALTKALYYAEKTNKLEKETFQQEDATTWLLMAKIYVHLNESQAAYQCFKKAQKLNAPISAVLPYLAEYYYNHKQFNKTADILSQESILKSIPTISEIAKFWNADDN